MSTEIIRRIVVLAFCDALAVKVPTAVFRALQGRDAVVEHLTVRRAGELPGVLRAYSTHHRRRAVRARWALGELHSLVIPCFGHAEFLPEALESVLRQDHRPLEVVLIDDASPDETRSVLRALTGQRHEGVAFRVLHHRRNRGQAAAINLGVLNSSGDAVTILNDDDILLDGALSTLRGLMARHRCHLVGTGCAIFEGPTPPRQAVDPSSAVEAATYLDAATVAASGPTATNMTHSSSTFTSAAWWAVRGYRPWARTRTVRPADRDFQLRLGSMFGMLVVQSEPFALWRWGSSMDSDRFT